MGCEDFLDVNDNPNKDTDCDGLSDAAAYWNADQARAFSDADRYLYGYFHCLGHSDRRRDGELTAASGDGHPVARSGDADVQSRLYSAQNTACSQDGCLFGGLG
mgnify:CR=1 FL=1